MGYAESLTIIGSVSVVLLLLLSLFFLTVPSRLALSNRLFAIFLLLTAADLSGWIAWPGAPQAPAVSFLRLSLTFLQMPGLLLYISSACFSDFRLRPIHLWHGAPFAVAGLLLWRACATPSAQGLRPVMILVLTGLHVQFYVYIVLAFLKLRRFRAIFRDNYADASSRTFSWLLQLCLAASVAHTFVLVKDLAGWTGSPVAQALNVAVSLTALAVTVWFAAKALYQPDLFRQVDAHQDARAEPDRKPDAETLARLDRLLAHMQTRAPYLDANLSLKKLARQMSMPARDLSVLINSARGQSFFEFINAYRIDRAADLLADPAHADMSVLDVLYEVGFNSKSSFNTAFKRCIGQTPSDYRRQRTK